MEWRSPVCLAATDMAGAGAPGAQGAFSGARWWCQATEATGDGTLYGVPAAGGRMARYGQRQRRKTG